MKKHLLFIALLIASTSTVCSQSLEWAATFGGTSYAAGKAIGTDASGNVYSTGYFYGLSDFDPSLGVANFTAAPALGCDIFITKLNPNATLAWAKQIGGGDGNDYALGMAVDQTTGDVYVTGWFHGAVDFDPGTDSFIVNSPGVDAVYVLKLDAAGEFVWVKTLTDGVGSYGYALAFDQSGNIYVVGEFDGTIDFDPGAGIQTATATANSDAFILKLDANGNYLMDIEFGGTGYDEIFGIAVDGSGYIYVTGGFDGTIDLDPGAGTTSYIADGYDIFISKFEAAGNLVWGQHMGGAGDEMAKGIGVDGSGNVYTTGKFTGTVDFDPGTGGTSYTATGFSDAFLTRQDAGGNLIWATKIGGPGLDEGTALEMAVDGGIVWTGGFQDTIDIEIGSGVTNLYNAEGTDILVAKFNPNITLAWAKSMGGNGTDWGYAVALDANENVYLTGQFTQDCDFDPNAGTAILSSLGENDIYVMKLGTVTGLEENALLENGISLYPNPTRGLLQINVERASALAVTNALGQVMETLSIVNSETIDVSAYAAGIYFVRDLNTGKALKFIKK
jgi:hypothetical protein